ncbi:MAG: octaprenyl diphosphate synthase [Gammaproteobacteria bacterium RIFCSPLOWO2_12_FULL_52_10]|nr:MAG: octaprenyl diphosphate synthase [Gammaproteobacteria bacterium RIFCSPLOWO2_12_FULL_52_10]
MDINSIRALITKDMDNVNELIERRLNSDVTLINQLAHYIVNSGGKRLRPALVLLSTGVFSYKGIKHLELAAIIEFIHTATLLHDDVVDASALRRGRETANQRWGNEASVLVGDFLYSRAFQMMVEVGSMPVMKVLADATNTIAKGEVQQLLNQHNADTTEASYLEVINNKTAKLFEAAAQLGAIINACPKEQEAALTAYGKHLGTAYQLIDDVLDYSAESAELGKNIGDDLAEGKPTLPLLYAMWHGTPVQNEIIRDAIVQTGNKEIDKIKTAIDSTGAIDYTARLARTEAQKAMDAIAQLPPSEYLEALYGLACFAVERTN